MVTGKLEVFSETEVPGCVYCIVSFNGRLVAAINNRVRCRVGLSDILYFHEFIMIISIL